MPKKFDITMGGERIGQALLRREGLYANITGRCMLSGDVKFHLYADTAAQSVDLGLLVPEDDAFVCRTKQPLKRFSGEIVGFSIKPKHAPVLDRFVPLSPEKPFSYLDRLENAYLTRRNGQVGIVIKEAETM